MSPVAETPPLKSLLAERGVSARAVAEAAGMHVSNLRHQLAGRRPMNAKVLLAVSEMCAVPVGELDLTGIALVDPRRSASQQRGWVTRREGATPAGARKSSKLPAPLPMSLPQRATT